ncbi:hypothetical protein ACFLIM_29045 [Nonomuraea sp. M3C6]|uniref:DNA-directed RNA polymerase specialized sigma subunit, sigma24 family n=1 Tax=Nonomuraea marmarensis TaxID=3351344 RepID=A0ABW7AIR4_9ACTN
MNKSTELSVFLTNYGPSFARTAYLLTGDADKARELAVSALATVGRRWSTVRWNQPVEAVLRELYRRYLSVTVPPPQAPGGYALAALPPKGRAAIVAQFHDGLPPHQAAAITGLWIAILEKETHQARAHLKATHPDLFATFAKPPPATEPPQEPTEPPQEASGDEHGPPDPPANVASWAAPSDTPSAPPETTTTQAPWTVPTQSSTPPTGPPQDVTPWAVPAQASAPWAVPAQAWDVRGAAGDPAMRAALIRISAEMPHVHLAEPVLSRIRRRRRVRIATWTTVSLGTIGALVALIAIAVSAVARNIEDTVAQPVSTGYTRAPDQVPEALHVTLTDPIRYAYTGYCEGSTNDTSDPQPCGQWRLETTSGKEWRLHGARAGYESGTGVALPLAISQDGHRLAYRDIEGSYVVRDLPTGTVKTIDLRNQPLDPHITSSPNGRYFAVDFGAADGATLDFDTGVTHHDYGDKIQILAVHNDGTRVVSEQRDVDDVRGHASVTTLRMHNTKSLVGGYRVDHGLLDYGGALAPDGHTLAMVTQDLKVITMDTRTGRVTGHRTTLEDYEVITVERWISADEVLVRQWDDDYVLFIKVNVRSGTATEFADEVAEWLDYDSPVGVLKK